MKADPGDRAVYVADLQPLYCCDIGFESRWRHGCSSHVFVV